MVFDFGVVGWLEAFAIACFANSTLEEGGPGALRDGLELLFGRLLAVLTSRHLHGASGEDLCERPLRRTRPRSEGDMDGRKWKHSAICAEKHSRSAKCEVGNETKAGLEKFGRVLRELLSLWEREARRRTCWRCCCCCLFVCLGRHKSARWAGMAAAESSHRKERH